METGWREASQAEEQMASLTDCRVTSSNYGCGSTVLNMLQSNEMTEQAEWTSKASTASGVPLGGSIKC